MFLEQAVQHILPSTTPAWMTSSESVLYFLSYFCTLIDLFLAQLRVLFTDRQYCNGNAYTGDLLPCLTEWTKPADL